MLPVKHVVISAAGIGSRLELNMPKCLVDIGGKKIIDYQLHLLRNIPNIRIVVGFMEDEVINYIRKIRKDVIFVRNPDYRTTSNSYSLHLATADLKEPFLSIDGDLIIDPCSFDSFLRKCGQDKSIVGITKVKTEEAVFAHLDDTKIAKFSFTEPAEYEWAGIAYLHNIKIQKNTGFVFKEIEKYLPLEAKEIYCHEVDTPEDLRNAIGALSQYNYNL